MTKPVRKVRGHGFNIIVIFQSLKMKQPIRCESTIERDLLYFLEYDPTVLAYYSQPFMITATDVAGEKRTYVPDFRVVRTDRKEIVECKPKERLQDAHTQQQVQLGTTWANANDYTFVIATDEDLRSGHVLANLKLLWRYSRLTVPTVLLHHSIAYLKASPQKVLFGDLARFLSETSSEQKAPQPFTQMPFIYSMLFQHILQTDLEKPITLDSPLWQTPVASHPGITGSLLRGSTLLGR